MLGNYFSIVQRIYHQIYNYIWFSLTLINQEPPFVEGSELPNQRMHRHSLHSKMQLVQLLDKLIVTPEESNNGDSYRQERTQSSSDNINLNKDNNYKHLDEEENHHQHFSSRVVQQEPSELSIMASIKQVKGNTGTLFTLMHYSEADGTHHR